jgi:hypothetical protein
LPFGEFCANFLRDCEFKTTFKGGRTVAHEPPRHTAAPRKELGLTVSASIPIAVLSISGFILLRVALKKPDLADQS